jgi:hypothetical protein
MAAPYDIFLTTVAYFADPDDIRMYDPTVAPDTPPVGGDTPFRMMMGLGT